MALGGAVPFERCAQTQLRLTPRSSESTQTKYSDDWAGNITHSAAIGIRIGGAWVRVYLTDRKRIPEVEGLQANEPRYWT